MSMSIDALTQAAYSRSLSPQNWATLVRGKSSTTPENLPDEILVSLLPHLLTPHPSPLHLSYLSHSLKTSPSLLSPSSVLSHLLSSSPSPLPIPSHILALLLSSSTSIAPSITLSLNHLETLLRHSLPPFPYPCPELLSLLSILLIEKAKEGGPIDSSLLSSVLGGLMLDDREGAIGLKGVLIGLGVMMPGLEMDQGVKGMEGMEETLELDAMTKMMMTGTEGGQIGVVGTLQVVASGSGVDEGQGTTSLDRLGEIILLSLASRPRPEQATYVQSVLTHYCSSLSTSSTAPVDFLISLFRAAVLSVSRGESSRKLALLTLPFFLPSLASSSSLPIDTYPNLLQKLLTSSQLSPILDLIDTPNAEHRRRVKPNVSASTCGLGNDDLSDLPSATGVTNDDHQFGLDFLDTTFSVDDGMTGAANHLPTSDDAAIPSNANATGTGSSNGFPPIRYELIESFLPYLSSSTDLDSVESTAFLDTLGYTSEEREKHRRKRVDSSSMSGSGAMESGAGEGEGGDVKGWFGGVLDRLMEDDQQHEDGQPGREKKTVMGEFGRVLDEVVVDYDSQEAVKEALMEKWTHLLDPSTHDLSLASRLASFFLASSSSGQNLRYLDVLFEEDIESQRSFVAKAMDVLFGKSWEEGDSYGDAQSSFAQIGQLALLAQTLIRRWNLTGFSPRIHAASIAYPLISLPPDDKALISGWLTALFGNHGISDDLLHQTPPKSLLRLATTLVSQAILAHQRQKLARETFLSGLSYFSQPLLSWCVVGVLEWLTREVRRLGLYSALYLTVLETLVLTPGLPTSVLRLTGQGILRLLDDPSLGLVTMGGTFDSLAVRQAIEVAGAGGEEPDNSLPLLSSLPARAVVQQVDALPFLNSLIHSLLLPSSSPSSQIRSPSLRHLPSLIEALGPTRVLQSLWEALLLLPQSPYSAQTLDTSANPSASIEIPPSFVAVVTLPLPSSPSSSSSASSSSSSSPLIEPFLARYIPNLARILLRQITDTPGSKHARSLVVTWTKEVINLARSVGTLPSIAASTEGEKEEKGAEGSRKWDEFVQGLEKDLIEESKGEEGIEEGGERKKSRRK